MSHYLLRLISENNYGKENYQCATSNGVTVNVISYRLKNSRYLPKKKELTLIEKLTVPTNISFIMSTKINDSLINLLGLPKMYTNEYAYNPLSNNNTNLINYRPIIQTWYQKKQLKVEFYEKINGIFAYFVIKCINNIWYIFGGHKLKQKFCCIGQPGKFQIKEKEYDLSTDILRLAVFDLNKLEIKQIHEIENRSIHAQYIDHTSNLFYFNLEFGDVLRPKQILAPQTSTVENKTMNEIQNMRYIKGCIIKYTNLDNNTQVYEKINTYWNIIIKLIKDLISFSVHTRNFDVIYKKVYNGLINMYKKNIPHYNFIEFEFYIHLSKLLIEFLMKKDNYVKLLQNNYFDSLFQQFLQEEEKDISKLEEKTEHLKNLRFDQLIQRTQLSDFTMDIIVCNNLQNEKYFYMLQSLMENHKIAIIMRGPSKSGKSTIVKLITKHAEEKKLTYSIHSRSNFYPCDRPLNIEELKKINQAHFQEFDDSNAHIKINLNNNLKHYQWITYTKSARSKGYLAILLNCTNSNQNNDQLIITKKYNYENNENDDTPPKYFNLIFNNNEIKRIETELKTINIDFQIKNINLIKYIKNNHMIDKKMEYMGKKEKFLISGFFHDKEHKFCLVLIHQNNRGFKYILSNSQKSMFDLYYLLKKNKNSVVNINPSIEIEGEFCFQW